MHLNIPFLYTLLSYFQLYIVFFSRYVVEKDVKNNVVFVSRNYFSFDKRRRVFRVGSLKWFSGSPPNNIGLLQCKIKQPSTLFV